MKKTGWRFIALSLAMLFMMSALIYQLSELTVTQGVSWSEQAVNKRTRTVSVKGMRGRIMDRNGIVLAYSQSSYNVEFLRNPDQRTEYYSAKYTESLIKTIEIIEAGGGTVIDTSYIRMDENGGFYYDWRVEAKESQIARYKNFCQAMGFNMPDKNDPDTWKSAQDAYKELRISWCIPEEMPYEEAVKIMSVRQEVLLNNWMAYVPVTIAYDVGMEVVAELEMHADELIGIQTSQSTTRVYPKGSAASHIVGYLSRTVTDEMIEEQGYDYSDYIGVSGIEAVMEEYLTAATSEHQGSRVIEVNKNGTQIRELSSTPAKDGDDVMLTIDLPLQQVTEKALENLIAAIAQKERDLIKEDKDEKYSNATDGDLDSINTAVSGAIIVMDVNTGDVLSMASYPSYDPNWFIKGLSDEQAQALYGEEAADTTPMWNKAVSATLAPGSIFKMITGMAGLMEGVIDIETTIDDNSPYIIVNEDGTEIKTGAPSCWQKNTSKHAAQNIVRALSNSCNYYFFDVSYRLGIDRLRTWAERFGLADSTQIELTGEAEGIIGGQTDMYDNTKELDLQRTSLPRLVYRQICSNLRKYLELRNMEIDDEAVRSCASRILTLQDGDLRDKGPMVRRIMSEELGIPEGITSATNWVQEIMTSLSEIQWKPTFTIRTGIGQGVMLVTPIAVARYFSAVANRGTVYNAHIVSKILDADGNTVLEMEPSVFDTIDAPAEYWDAIQEGIKGVVSPEDGGTASDAFSEEFQNAGFLNMISGKTGSAQIGNNPIDVENTSWFIAYTPRENPEIAITVCVPNGFSGSSSAPAIEEIITYYYTQKEAVARENLVNINGIAP